MTTTNELAARIEIVKHLVDACFESTQAREFAGYIAPTNRPDIAEVLRLLHAMKSDTNALEIVGFFIENVLELEERRKSVGSYDPATTEVR